MNAPQIRRQREPSARHRGAVDDTGPACRSPAGSQQEPAAAQPPALKTTFVPLTNNANAVLLESPDPSPKRRIVAINTHPDHNNNFNYFIGRELAARGYRAIGVNYYGAEDHARGIPAADRGGGEVHAQSLPGVEKVVFATHSGGGPVLTFYQEVAEKGPAACQEPSRLYPCRGEGLTGLPKVDGLLLLDINIGAPHRMLSLDPAVETAHPRKREPVPGSLRSAERVRSRDQHRPVPAGVREAVSRRRFTRAASG